jgi:hypothetical protein
VRAIHDDGGFVGGGVLGQWIGEAQRDAITGDLCAARFVSVA